MELIEAIEVAREMTEDFGLSIDDEQALQALIACAQAQLAEAEEARSIMKAAVLSVTDSTATLDEAYRRALVASDAATAEYAEGYQRALDRQPDSTATAKAIIRDAELPPIGAMIPGVVIRDLASVNAVNPPDNSGPTKALDGWLESQARARSVMNTYAGCQCDHCQAGRVPATVESPDDILQVNAPGGGLVSMTRRERDAMVARDIGKVVHIESSIAKCLCPDCQAREIEWDSIHPPSQGLPR